MKRRAFITLAGGALAWPLVARAQQAKTFRIGILNFENPEPLGDMLRAALRDLGYVDGHNAQFAVRTAQGDRARLAGSTAAPVGPALGGVGGYPPPALPAPERHPPGG